MNSELPTQRVAQGIFIGNMIISSLAVGSLMMLAAAVWIATGS